MNEPSFSLLNQEEIDILIRFLHENKDDLTSSVLSQTSIDKLIQFLSASDINELRLNPLDDPAIKAPANFDLLKELHIREDPSEVCELIFKVNEETKLLELYAKNRTSQKEHPITPTTLDRTEILNGASSWGFAIVPALFDRIARIFTLKYTRKTYDDICALYAEKNFGSSTAKLPAMYYPASNFLLDNLL